MALFQLKQRLHVKSQYLWNKWYYKTPHGPIFIQMIPERTGGDTILAIVQQALSLIQAVDW